MTSQPAGAMKVGLVLPIAEDDATHATLGYRAIREVALQAEAAGLDLGVGLRPPALPIWREPHRWHLGGLEPAGGAGRGHHARAARHDRDVRAVPQPGRVGQDGRHRRRDQRRAADLGLGAGWHQPEFGRLGAPFDHKVDRFEEALQIIVPLLREGRVDFTGKYYSAPNCELRPRGPRPRGPEILVASFKPRRCRN